MTVNIIHQIALPGCRRTEMIKPQRVELDTDANCPRLVESKESVPIRHIPEKLIVCLP